MKMFFIVMFYYISYSSMCSLGSQIQKVYFEIWKLSFSFITDNLIIYLQQTCFSFFFSFSLLIFVLNSLVEENNFSSSARVITAILLMGFCQLLLFMMMLFSDTLLIKMIPSKWAMALLFLIYIMGGISFALFQSNIIRISNMLGKTTLYLTIVAISPGILIIFNCVLIKTEQLFFIYLFCFSTLTLSFFLFVISGTTQQFPSISNSSLFYYSSAINKNLFEESKKEEDVDDADDDDDDDNNNITNNVNNILNTTEEDMNNILLFIDNTTTTLSTTTTTTSSFSSILVFRIKLIYKYLILHFLTSFLDGLLMIFSLQTISYFFSYTCMSQIIYNSLSFISAILSKTLFYWILSNKKNLIPLALLFQFFFVFFFLIHSTTKVSGVFLSFSTGAIYVTTLNRIHSQINETHHTFMYSIWFSFILLGMIVGINLEMQIIIEIKKIF